VQHTHTLLVRANITCLAARHLATGPSFCPQAKQTQSHTQTQSLPFLPSEYSSSLASFALGFNYLHWSSSGLCIE